MPLYDFVCRECKKEVEKITPSSTTKVECSNCGGVSERVEVNGSQSFYFRGQGTEKEQSMAPRKGK